MDRVESIFPAHICINEDQIKIKIKLINILPDSHAFIAYRQRVRSDQLLATLGRFTKAQPYNRGLGLLVSCVALRIIHPGLTSGPFKSIFNVEICAENLPKQLFGIDWRMKWFVLWLIRTTNWLKIITSTSTTLCTIILASFGFVRQNRISIGNLLKLFRHIFVARICIRMIFLR